MSSYDHFFIASPGSQLEHPEDREHDAKYNVTYQNHKQPTSDHLDIVIKLHSRTKNKFTLNNVFEQIHQIS
jgi:hypothetical protein